MLLLEGDLDGDDYFVCSNDVLINLVTTVHSPLIYPPATKSIHLHISLTLRSLCYNQS